MHRCLAFSTTLMLFLGMLSFGVSASDAIRLNEALRGDCTVAYWVFDAVHRKGEDRSRVTEQSTLFVSDLCDLGERVNIGVDGRTVFLDRKRGVVRKGLSGSALSYGGHGYALELRIGDAIESFYDPDTECTEQWHSVTAVIRNGRRRRTVEGTLTGGCP